jgi:hypothetical protein
MEDPTLVFHETLYDLGIDLCSDKETHPLEVFCFILFLYTLIDSVDNIDLDITDKVEASYETG